MQKIVRIEGIQIKRKFLYRLAYIIAVNTDLRAFKQFDYYITRYKLEIRMESNKDKSKINYTYIIRCSDGSLYTGWTNDLEKRLEAHNSGCGAKYTRNRRPVELIYVEKFESKNEAMSREWHIKRMSREDKLKLIKGHGIRL